MPDSLKLPHPASDPLIAEGWAHFLDARRAIQDFESAIEKICHDVFASRRAKLEPLLGRVGKVEFKKGEKYLPDAFLLNLQVTVHKSPANAGKQADVSSFWTGMWWREGHPVVAATGLSIYHSTITASDRSKACKRLEEVLIAVAPPESVVHTAKEFDVCVTVPISTTPTRAEIRSLMDTSMDVFGEGLKAVGGIHKLFE